MSKHPKTPLQSNATHADVPTIYKLGSRLRYLRSVKNLTQAEVAEKAGLSLRQINRIECGARSPSFPALENISQALETNLLNLFLFADDILENDPSGEHPGFAETGGAWPGDYCTPVWVGTWTLASSDGRRTNWSSAVYSMLGYQPYSVKPTAKRFLKHVRQEEHSAVQEFLDKAGQGQKISLVLQVKTKSLSERTLCISVDTQRTKADAPENVLLILQDITEFGELARALVHNKCELEEHVRERNRELSLAVEKYQFEALERSKAQARLRISDLMVWHSSNAQIFVDKNGIIGSVNAAYERLVGASSQQLLGRIYADFLVELLSKKFYDQEVRPQLVRVSRLGEAAFWKGWVEVKHLGRLFLRISYSPCWEGKEILGLVVTIHDLTALVTSQREREESETRYRSLYEDTPAMLHSIDKDGKIISVSNPWLEKLGYTRDEVLGRRSVDFFTEESKCRALEENIPIFFETGSAKDLPYQMVTKDGRILDVLMSGVSEFGKDGVFVRSMAVTADVTERRKTEKALRESEQRFRALAENLPVLLNAGTKDARFTYWNKTSEIITGYSKEEVIENPKAFALMYPDQVYAARILCEWEEAGSEFTNKEIALTAKDGTTRHIVWSNLPPELSYTGDDVWAVGVDVTRRKLSEEALMQREQLLEVAACATLNLLRDVELGPCVTDILACLGQVTNTDRVYVFRDHVDEETGLLLTSQTWEWVNTGIVPQIDNPDLKNVPYLEACPRWRQAMEAGKCISGHVRHFPDEERGLLEPQNIQSLLVVPIHSDERVWGFLGFDSVRTARDWTFAEENVLRIVASAIGAAIARKANETFIKQQAETTSRVKSAFLAKMSHEVRTPLSGIMGLTDMLLDTPLSPEQREYLELVRNARSRMLTLTTDILDLSKIEAGKLELKDAAFEPRRTVEDVGHLLAGQAHKKGLDLVWDVNAKVPRLLVGDEGCLRQVLLNLAVNALKFTDQGVVVVHAGLEEDRANKTLLRFTVRDTGPGIPPDLISDLFSPYNQVGKTSRHGGTGLGLAICKELVELMGGTIGVESTEGRGSIFWFTAWFKKEPEPKTDSA
ncbi:PAS domain S-box protein [Desulfonatronum sp. SC1]|uniref:PAS domain S-box protein n=1 Tax=Desulfonatronum sp. SC1 TaxID=2109626 RepID=UPI000D300CD0|nr:PAS domain S-box protein [Desulfonatronum sp. SC1]PTN35303.1 hypothetical protein C6366_11175 [Desulfonatronum sp. SC1]